jgi:DNA-binding CsgD family transcriptional regulator/photosystem II stability/assembly factor-like uncharacterized protein
MTISKKQFSERERDVAQLLLRARSNKQIASELGISTRTVEFHLSHIYTKLGVTSRTEAVLILRERQLWKSAGATEFDMPVKSTVETHSEFSENGLETISRRFPMKNLFYGICGGLFIIGIFIVLFMVRTPSKSVDFAPTLTYLGTTKLNATTVSKTLPTIPSVTFISIPTIFSSTTVIPSTKMTTGTKVWTSHGLEGRNLSSLEIDPLTPTILYATTSNSNSGASIFKSIDSGRNWRELNDSGIYPPVYDLKIDPTAPTTFYAAIPHGVIKSTNGGETLYEVSGEFSSDTIYVLAIDPVTPTTLYAGTIGNGVLKSIDGGWTWSTINNGVNDFYVCALAIDPSTPAILYAGTFNGIVKSIDGGGNWSPVYISQTESHVCALAIDPLTPSTVYAAVGDINHTSGVIKTMNGGVSWSSLNSDFEDVSGIGVILIDPKMPTTIYVGTQKYDKENPGGGVFMSTDGGVSWFNIGLIGIWVNDLAIDPTLPSTLYAGTNNGVFLFS